MDGGDTSSQRFLADELARVRPDDAVLSEEGLEDPRRFRRDRVWIIDPLDGTREFGEPGRWDWAVHVALWSSGRFLAGAVSLPAVGITFSTDPPPPVADVQRERPRLVTSRTRAPYAAAVVADGARCRAGAARVGRGQGDVGGQRRHRHLRPRRRDVPVGLGGPGRRRPGRRLARQPDRRLAAASTTAATPGCPISWCAVQNGRLPCSTRSTVDPTRDGAATGVGLARHPKRAATRGQAMTSDGNDDGRLPTDSPAEKRSGWLSATQLAGLASLGAGAIHAAAIGIHAEHATLARLFVAVAAAQLAAGLVMLVKGGRAAAVATALVNAGAVAAWAVTRVSGISWIEGLEQSEAPQFADTACAALGAVAAVAAVVALVREQTRPAASRLGVPAVAVGALTVVAMMYGGTHVHSHDDGTTPRAAGAEHTHGDEAATADGEAAVRRARPPEDAAAMDGAATADGHAHGDDAAATDGHAHPDDAAGASALAWPRAWDPSQPIDFSGVSGRDSEAGSTCRAARRPHARRPAGEVRRRHDAVRPRVPLDRRRRHRLRALHQHRLHRRRPLPRPQPSRVARLPRRRRPAHARVGDVHRRGDADRRPEAGRATAAR